MKTQKEESKQVKEDLKFIESLGFTITTREGNGWSNCYYETKTTEAIANYKHLINESNDITIYLTYYNNAGLGRFMLDLIERIGQLRVNEHNSKLKKLLDIVDPDYE